MTSSTHAKGIDSHASLKVICGCMARGFCICRTRRSATGASRWCVISLWRHRLAPVRWTAWLGIPLRNQEPDRRDVQLSTPPHRVVTAGLFRDIKRAGKLVATFVPTIQIPRSRGEPADVKLGLVFGDSGSVPGNRKL